MNWDAIGAIAELVGAVGVVASLLYVATQVRTSNRASAVQAKLAVELQELAFVEVPYVNFGQWILPTAFRENLDGVIVSPVPFFWNISKR